MNTYIAKFRHFLSYHRYQKRNIKVTVKAKQLSHYMLSQMCLLHKETTVLIINIMDAMSNEFDFSVSWHMLFVYALVEVSRTITEEKIAMISV